MVNTLRAWMKKVDNTQEQMDNVSRDMEILRPYQKMLNIKNAVAEMKTACDGLVRRQHG